MPTPTMKQMSRAGRRLLPTVTLDRRVRWFARINHQWIPMTQLYKAAAQLEHCNTYRAQGACEVIGVRVRKFNRRSAKRLLLQIIVTEA